MRRTLLSPYDLMAFSTPGESPLWYRHESRKGTHSHENAEAIKDRTPQPGHAVNLHLVRCGGNSESNDPNPPITEERLGFWITPQGICAEGIPFDGMHGAITA
jgi:hypothetical protein